jgi:hypothetical protein
VRNYATVAKKGEMRKRLREARKERVKKCAKERLM